MSNVVTSYLENDTGNKYSNMDLLNSVLALANKDYGTDFKRIKPSLKINHSNLPMEKLEANENEIFKSLVQRIGMVVGKGLHFSNPLGIFKSEDMEFSDIIQEYFVHETTASDYNAKSNEHPYTWYDTDMTVFYHQSGREDKFSRSIEERWTKKAFTSERAFDDFIDKMLMSLVSSDELKEYELTKDLVTKSLSPVTFNGKTIKSPNTAIDITQDGWIEKLNKELLNRSKYFSVPSTTRSENGIGRANRTRVEDQVLILNTELSTELDSLLANPYNVLKIKPITNIVVVDEFPTYNGKDDLEGVTPICALVSAKSLNLVDTLYKMTGVYDEGNLKYNVFLHHHQKAWYSLIENAHVYHTK